MVDLKLLRLSIVSFSSSAKVFQILQVLTKNDRWYVAVLHLGMVYVGAFPVDARVGLEIRTTGRTDGFS